MSRIRERCREIMREIQAGQDPALYADELGRMEEWLRERGQWRDENTGFGCPWIDHCRCTHKGCADGWLNADVPGRTVAGNESLRMAIRCPECSRARLLAEHAAKARSRKRGA